MAISVFAETVEMTAACDVAPIFSLKDGTDHDRLFQTFVYLRVVTGIVRIEAVLHCEYDKMQNK
jgi:hypothetical protein